MTDGQILYLVFAAFYLFECVRWVPARCWIFHAKSNGKNWTHAKPLELLRTRGGALAILKLLPPFQVHAMAATWPCAPHEEGLCVWDEEHKFTQYLPWDSLKVNADESTLYFTEKLQVPCLNASDAQDWVKRIIVWKAQSQAQRHHAFLKVAQEMLDGKPLIKAAQSLQRNIRWHNLLSEGIFTCGFLVLPFVYWRYATTYPTFTVIGFLYLLMFTQAFLLWRKVRSDSSLRPGARLRIFSVAFFPPSSIRVVDWLSQMKMPSTHPLTLLQKEKDQGCFHREAAKLWRVARWPLGDFPYKPWDGPEVEALSAYFKKAGLVIENLEEPPKLPADSSYCPRCLGTYAKTVDECSDCKGISLIKPASAEH